MTDRKRNLEVHRNRSLGYAFALVTLVTLAASCDATRRDWSRCDPEGRCNTGYRCEKQEGGISFCIGVPDAEMAADAAVSVDASQAIDVPLADSSVGGVEDAVHDSADLSALDTAGVAADVFVPDAPGTCLTDQECTSAEPLCLDFVCAKCAADSDCAGRAGNPACDGSSGRCVACVADKHCAGMTPVCDTANAKCVGCLAAADCTADATKAFCVANQCAGCAAAGATACTGAKPVCATTGSTAGQCVECIDNSGCSKDPANGFCVNNACTGCQNAGQAGQDGGSRPVRERPRYVPRLAPAPEDALHASPARTAQRPRPSRSAIPTSVAAARRIRNVRPFLALVFAAWIPPARAKAT